MHSQIDYTQQKHKQKCTEIILKMNREKHSMYSAKNLQCFHKKPTTFCSKTLNILGKKAVGFSHYFALLFLLDFVSNCIFSLPSKKSKINLPYNIIILLFFIFF